MVSLLERTSRAALDLLFPPRCALCRAAGSMLCKDCIAVLPTADGHRCYRCWTPITRPGLCAHCAEDGNISYEAVRAPFVMEDGVRSLVHQLKYGGMSALGEPMGALLAASHEAGADLVVPVPLHRGRLRSRGYNQAALLGRRLALVANLPFDANAVRRIRATKPLARSMHREERRAIVAGAFAARSERVAGRRILLVDDCRHDRRDARCLRQGATRSRCRQHPLHHLRPRGLIDPTAAWTYSAGTPGTRRGDGANAHAG